MARRASASAWNARPLRDCRGPSLLQQDRAHDGTGPPRTSRSRDGQQSKNGPRRSGSASGRGSQERLRRRSWWSATAGTTAAGVIDPLPNLARYSANRRISGFMWTPRGAAPPFSRRACGTHLAGIEAADSITCDAHKWFSVPMGAGMFFCRHPESVSAAFHAETSYMPAETQRAGCPIRTPPPRSGRGALSA